jgi:hypothetical protein
MLYHGQMAWYRDISVAAGELDEYAEVYIVAAETNEPYDSAVFRVPETALAAGRKVYTDLLDYWVHCRDSGHWPGMHMGVCDLELPHWTLGMEK